MKKDPPGYIVSTTAIIYHNHFTITLVLLNQMKAVSSVKHLEEFGETFCFFWGLPTSNWSLNLVFGVDSFGLHDVSIDLQSHFILLNWFHPSWKLILSLPGYVCHVWYYSVSGGNCHSPTQPQHELELDLIMGRKPPTPPHPTPPHRNF